MTQQSGPDSPIAAGLGEILKANSQHVEAWAKSCGTAYERIGKVNEQTFEFWTRRLKEDLEMPAKLANCHEPAEFAQTCSRFFEQMIDDYQAQANRVASLMSDAVKESPTVTRNGPDGATGAPKQK